MLFTRTSNKKYVIGFDLGETGSQISWSESGAEPVTFAQKDKGGDVENLFIPTVLSKKFGANIWFCGQEAETRASHGDGTIVRHILSSALQGRAILIEGQEYDPCSLLALYVRRVLALIADTVPTSEISVLLFTMETIDQNTVEMLGRMKGFLNLSLDGLYWEDHQSSFYSFLLCQNASLHERDVLLCEWNGESAMKLVRMCYNGGTKPAVVYARTDTAPEMSARMTAKEQRDASFLHVCRRAAPQGQISSVFLIGQGFADQWMKESLSYLSYHRRVFLGNNLYSKGAAWSALLRRDHRSVQDQYFFLGENCLSCNVGMLVLHAGSSRYLAVRDAGESWYDLSWEREFIVDSGNEVHFIFTPLTGGAVRDETMKLEGLPNRAGRTTRIRVSLSMADVHTLCVHVEDVGFGEIAAGSGLSWDQRFTV